MARAPVKNKPMRVPRVAEALSVADWQGSGEDAGGRVEVGGDDEGVQRGKVLGLYRLECIHAAGIPVVAADFVDNY